jgi:hypothetical protein
MNLTSRFRTAHDGGERAAWDEIRPGAAQRLSRLDGTSELGEISILAVVEASAESPLMKSFLPSEFPARVSPIDRRLEMPDCLLRRALLNRASGEQGTVHPVGPPKEPPDPTVELFESQPKRIQIDLENVGEKYGRGRTL